MVVATGFQNTFLGQKKVKKSKIFKNSSYKPESGLVVTPLGENKNAKSKRRKKTSKREN